jgi:hypothetical protein
MKQHQSSSPRPVHQTVASPIEFQSGGQSIQIEFTDQQLSPHAGTAPFWAFLRQSGWIGLLERCLPHPRSKSNNHLSAVSKVLGFVQGLLCGAKKLTHVAYLRRDPLVPEMLGIKRVASQSVLARFFQGFASAGRNLACFRRLFGWCLERLPSRAGGYALDLDSTRLLHEDGHQEGVAVGYTRLGTKPCLHPLLAVFSEVRLVAAFWLRAGNSSCANNVVSFFLGLWENLPHHLRLRVVRADSGFCVSERLRLWEQLRLKFVVVARLTLPVQRLIRQETDWAATEVEGNDVAEGDFREADWPADTRRILIRHRVKDKRGRAGGVRGGDQGTGRGLWVAAVGVSVILGDGGGVVLRSAGAQPGRAVRAQAGLAGGGDGRQPALLAVRDGGRDQSSAGPDHDQAGRAAQGKRLVA